jgi:hypothetical protein
MLCSPYRSPLALFALMVALVAQAAEPPWRTPYGGAEATGPDVIALWQFDGESLKDISGNGHDLKLRGQGQLVETGRFGGCLESFPSDAKNDNSQGAYVPKNDPALTPKGAFSIDAWVKLKPEAEKYPSLFIVDKKNYYYASELPKANKDYFFYLGRMGKQWALRAGLGFGTTSAGFASRALPLPVDEWHHVAFTYDGAGTVRFFLDGRSVGGATKEGLGPVARGGNPLVVGDRVGSVHKGFAGFLDQVRIRNGAAPFFTGELTLSVAGGRTAFARMEADATVQLTISNDTGEALPAGKLDVELGGQRRALPLKALGSGGQKTVAIPLNTALRPGEYMMKARYAAGASSAAAELPVTLRPRPLPHTMPVVMWGTGNVEQVRKMGFTHQIKWMGYFDGHAVKTKEPAPEILSGDRRQEVLESLDNHFQHGLGVILKSYPGSYMARHPKMMETYQRVDREGEPLKHMNVCGNVPGVPEIGFASSASAMQAFGHMPAVQACMVQSEVRDGNAPCFHDYDKKAFEAYAGHAIPDEIRSKRGVRWQQLPDFPPNRVIPDRHPILTYYRWFWKKGDGWNGFHSGIHRGVKSTGREDVWTYHDPAVRVPSIWGSGGEVDVISQWTYSYPDALKIGQATDELFAMAEGRPGQKVMKMTQVIWKRAQTAVKQTPADKLAAWETELPDAKYYTISPDHMREAFWSKISRPVQGIMYHGWASLVLLGDNAGGYTYTNAETGPVLEELLHEVIEPLGPTLMQVPEGPVEVALLESFTSQMFAGRGPYGWGVGWTADSHLVLQWARYQPKVVYEETILRDGLQGVKVLVMPDCDVLPESVAEAIRTFQDAGGIIVADEHVAPAILPDIMVSSYRRMGKADMDKKALQALAQTLRAELDQVYERPFDTSDPDLVVRRRRAGAADYVFVVNDRRTFGDYVGQHRKVMEKGVALSGQVTLPADKGFIYDLTSHKRVRAKPKGGKLVLPCKLGPGGGNVYLLSSQELGEARIAAPASAQLGGTVKIAVDVLDTKGGKVDAIVPLRLDIVDGDGRLAEFSGWYGAVAGHAEVSLTLGPNDQLGKWRIRARNLASGKTAETTFTVTR